MTENPPSRALSASNLTGSGFDQSGVRSYNERFILSLLRQHGAMSRADIARLSGLSAQTISVIIRTLEKDSLLEQGELQRGRVGQPSLPMHLKADGVFSFGLKIGRRSAELVLVDFLGNIRALMHKSYNWPSPDEIIGFTLAGIERFTAQLLPEQRSRIQGLGIALPHRLWDWVGEVGAPAEDINVWLTIDLPAIFSSYFAFPVLQQNDNAAACGAELTYGKPDYPDFVYFYIGSFIGGGVVLNNTLYTGRTGNAGALGSMPMHMATQAHSIQRHPAQLIDTASLFVLERELHRAGIDTTQLWEAPENWDISNPAIENWINLTARSLAHTIMASAAVIDFPAAIIDGWLPSRLRLRIIAATSEEMARFDWQNIHTPEIISGKTGIYAKALGAARLPIFKRYLFDQSVLFKHPA